MVCHGPSCLLRRGSPSPSAATRHCRNALNGAHSCGLVVARFCRFLTGTLTFSSSTFFFIKVNVRSHPRIQLGKGSRRVKLTAISHLFWGYILILSPSYFNTYLTTFFPSKWETRFQVYVYSWRCDCSERRTSFYRWTGHCIYAGLDAVEKRNVFPCRESNPGRPARSLSLYSLSYPGPSFIPTVLFLYAKMTNSL
jgi:hypothetical protein